MKLLADEVAIHQSTLTRIIEKLERQELVTRTRRQRDQRSVRVSITEKSRQTYKFLEEESEKLAAGLLELLLKDKRDTVVESLGIVASIFDPNNQDFQNLLKNCCSGRCSQEGKK